ncbi:hypothetical protein E2C01_093648 [Portunus trituberculatus]|uniref:Uncharacterized protein n=1 Tax=Portunus trituberculatus TaxID=210409 RepID=A0A5B7JUR2_PORTR|nr:hypothetical protein [Portunus trituberculatus]
MMDTRLARTLRAGAGSDGRPFVTCSK